MELTRRDALAVAMGAAALAALPMQALAAEDNGSAAIMDAFTGGADVADGGVEVTAPEIAENGNTVPVGVSAAGAVSIILVSTANPNPEVATFHFGKLSGSSEASTRIRLAKTQDLIAIARMADGSFARGSRNVKVTIGGCGG